MKNQITVKTFIFLFLASIIAGNGIFAQSNNNAYVFNGESSYVGILDGDALTANADQTAYQYFDNPAFTNNSISVESWVYLIGESPGVKMPIIYRSFDGGYESFSLYIKDRVAYFTIGNGAGVVSTLSETPVPAFTWVHLVGTYDGQNLKFYYNGRLIQNVPITLGAGSNAGSGGLFIGKSEEGAFKGLIDEVRIWRIALADNNINKSGGSGTPSENYPQSLAPYLNGQWSFNEFSFFNGIKAVQDLSEYKNHLRVYDIDEIVNSKQPPFIVVNSTADDSDLQAGDGKADAGEGLVTFRAAIEEANALSGSQIIYFYIPGSAPFMIQPGSALPDITDQVVIDATTQSGYSGSPLVEISGAYGGLNITAGGSTVKGLVLNHSAGYGLSLSSGGGNSIADNKIAGILLSSSENNIDGNVITNSFSDGVTISTAAENNRIGVSSGNEISANTGYGISILSASGNQLTNNTIHSNSTGGVSVTNSTGTINENTISSNSGLGIGLYSSTEFEITNNTIGTNASGGISISNSTASITGNSVTGKFQFRHIFRCCQ